MVDTRTAPYGLFLLRVALGAMFLAHGLLKFFVFTPAGFAGYLAAQGLPTFIAWPLILAEIFGGAAILLGVYARPVAVLLLPILLGALNVHAGNGWVFSNAGGGWEFPAFLVVIALVIALAGEGAFALKPSQLLPVGRRLAHA